MDVLKSQLLQQKTIKQRFRFPLTTEQAVDLLTAAYQTEVAFRHNIYVADETTASNIKRFAEFLTLENSKFGAMFCGVCGNGKTTMLYAFQNALNYLTSYGAFGSRPIGIRIIDSLDVVQYAKDHTQFRKLREIEMIAIEDIGREPREVLDFGNILNPIVDLFEYRYNKQLFTLTTTNLTSKQIREAYGKRLADRFNEMLEVIIFRNSTYRK